MYILKSQKLGKSIINIVSINFKHINYKIRFKLILSWESRKDVRGTEDLSLCSW